MEWYQRSAKQGFPKAQIAIGQPFNFEFAQVKPEVKFEWDRKAAEQGHIWGLFAMAENYYKGTGVKQDFIEALKWHILGERIDTDTIGHFRDDIEEHMSRGNMAKAKRRADAWKPSLPPFKSLACTETEFISPGLCPLPDTAPQP